MLGARLVRASHHALVFLLVVGSIVTLSAQSVLDPRYVEFDPSADHNTLASDGTPLVSRYYLSIYPQGSTTAFATVDIGKPNPGTGGVIRVDFLPLLTVLPTPGVTYEARVTAMGPGGATASAASNTFGYSVACAPAISPTSRAVSETATTGSVTVSAATGCAWTAVSNASWITITGGSSGTANGAVSYSVAANTVATQRTGTMTIAGQTFTITQAAAGCTYSLTPTSRTASAAGESNSTGVTAPTGCSWTAASGASWITVTGGASGSGNGTVSYSVAANTAGTERTGSLTVAGQAFTVTQTAAACTFSLSPTGRTSPATGESSTATVAATTGCSWTATSGASWIAISTGASGSGNGTVAFTVAANTSTTQRSGTMTIAGQTFTVTQSGTGCTYSISPTSRNVSASGGSSTASVSAPTGCSWSAVSNATWLTVTGGATGSGNGSVSFTAAANGSLQSRSGTVTIAGQTLTVNQSAGTCSYTISPTSMTVAATAGSASAAVTTASGCTWSTTSNVSWITVASGSGNGSGTASFNVAANNTSSSRSGTLTIAGRTLTVAQSGNGCTYVLSPTSRSLAATAGSSSVLLTTGPQCPWTATASANWITVSNASGSSSGNVTYSVTANNSANARTATVTIASQVHTVTQAGSPPPSSPRGLRIVTAGGN